VRRRRQCTSCGHRFTTYERYERGPLYVRKRDGERQLFDRAKLRGGLARAAHKRPVPATAIDAIVDRIEAAAERAGGELPARRIGEMCLDGLRRIDRISYLQYAAVYKQLDVGSLLDEAAQIAPSPAAGSVRPASDPA
jgi:transcriptional repressor NrdR